MIGPSPTECFSAGSNRSASIVRTAAFQGGFFLPACNGRTVVMAKKTGIRMLRKRNVLRYTKERAHAGTLRNHYAQWREDQGLPAERCDIPECMYYSDPLKWNGDPLKLILDHKNGVNSDNRAENLRFLCPNCDAQRAETRGGANRRQVGKDIGGFWRLRRGTQLRDYCLPIEPAQFTVTCGTATFTIRRRRRRKRKASVGELS